MFGGISCIYVFVLRWCVCVCAHACVCFTIIVSLRSFVDRSEKQTCLLLRFGRKVYALKALFTLELPGFTLLGCSLRLWVNYDRFV